MPYTLQEALAAFRRAPLLTGLSAAMIALSLFVVGLFGIGAHNVREVLTRVEERVEVVAYLRDETPQESVALAREDIESLPAVREIFYISREQALELAREELTDFSAIFAELDVNPLPASLEIHLNPGYTNPDAVATVAERAAVYPFVEDVRYGSDWLDKVYLLRRIAGAASAVLGVTFALVAALIIGAAVRIAIFARRDEIAIMRLVGAKDGFIRRPFLLEGLMTGLMGALLAAAGTFVVYRILSRSVFQLEWMPTAWLLGGIVAGGFLGMAASYVAVRRYLREV